MYCLHAACDLQDIHSQKLEFSQPKGWVESPCTPPRSCHLTSHRAQAQVATSQMDKCQQASDQGTTHKAGKGRPHQAENDDLFEAPNVDPNITPYPHTLHTATYCTPPRPPFPQVGDCGGWGAWVWGDSGGFKF